MYIEKLKDELNVPVKLVFNLKESLKHRTEYVNKVINLSLNESKPHMGLKYDKGLYNSKEWWDNIDNGAIETFYSYGVIAETYEAGQDHIGRANSFKYKDLKGKAYSESMYYSNKKDYKHFKEGHLVIIYYALVEYKNGEFLDKVIEMAISKIPYLA